MGAATWSCAGTHVEGVEQVRWNQIQGTFKSEAAPANGLDAQIRKRGTKDAVQGFDPRE